MKKFGYVLIALFYWLSVAQAEDTVQTAPHQADDEIIETAPHQADDEIIETAPNQADDEIQTAPHVDIDKYLGTWHEIARLPVSFEKKCTDNITATYSLDANDPDIINVENTCDTDTGNYTADGIAWIVDKETNAKLEVSFVPLAKTFKWFSGDYWIMYVDPNYQYAVVGEPSRDGLWLLARADSVPDATYANFLEIAQENGFNTENIIKH